jgi:hypothetical protein
MTDWQIGFAWGCLAGFVGFTAVFAGTILGLVSSAKRQMEREL